MSNNFKRVNIRVPEDVHRWFMQESERTLVSMSALMSMALQNYVQMTNVQRNMPEFLEMMKRYEDRVMERYLEPRTGEAWRMSREGPAAGEGTATPTR